VEGMCANEAREGDEGSQPQECVARETVVSQTATTQRGMENMYIGATTSSRPCLPPSRLALR